MEIFCTDLHHLNFKGARDCDQLFSTFVTRDVIFEVIYFEGFVCGRGVEERLIIWGMMGICFSGSITLEPS